MGVNVQDKQSFIRWYLINHPPEQREVVWLLEYIMKRQQLLKKVHFIYEAHLTPRSIILSNVEDENRPFRFYKEHIVTTDVDKAFHDIRMNPDKTLYIELIFQNVRQSMMYSSVLEENPYLPDDYYLYNQDYEAIDHFLDNFQKVNQRKAIEQKINQALDQGDEKAFLKWSKQLNDLNAKQTD